MTKKLDLTKPLRYVYGGKDLPARLLTDSLKDPKHPFVFAVDGASIANKEIIVRTDANGCYYDKECIANAAERVSTFFAFYHNYEKNGGVHVLVGVNQDRCRGYSTLEEVVNMNCANSGSVCPIIEIITEDGKVVDSVLHLGKGSLA